MRNYLLIAVLQKGEGERIMKGLIREIQEKGMEGAL